MLHRWWWIARLVDFLYWLECSTPVDVFYVWRKAAERWCIATTGRNIYGQKAPKWL